MTICNDLIALLRAGISGNIAVDLSSNVDWNAIEEFGVRHGVLPILFDGYQTYFEQKGVQAPVDVKLRWYAATQHAEKHYNEHLVAIKSLTEYFAEEGIKTMVLKGFSLSLCYPKPSHRPCGDVDVYLFEKYKEADTLLETKAGINIDRSEHHHTVFNWTGVMVENHYDFINRHAHNSSKWLDDELKKLSIKSKEKRGNIIIPDATLHAVFLIRHTGAHFSSSFISLRHLIDWWVFNKEYGLQVDWNYVKTCDEKVGMTEFHRCLDVCAKRLMEDDFGKSYDQISERAWNDILMPEFREHQPYNWRKYLFMWRRWWANRWKNKMMFNEPLCIQLVYLIKTHMLNPEYLLED